MLFRSNLPVTVPVGGTLRLLPDALLNLSCSAQSLAVDGTLDLQLGSRLRVDGCNRKTVSIAAGAALLGNGTLRLDSANLVLAAGDWNSPIHLQPDAGANISVPGVFTIPDGSSVSGSLSAAAFVVPPGANVAIGNANLSSRLTIGANATVDFFSHTSAAALTAEPGSTNNIARFITLTLNGPSTNRGTLRLGSRNDGGHINGSGSLVNEGLLEVFAREPVSSGSEATFNLPVTVPVGGTLRLLPDALLNLSCSAQSLAIDGTSTSSWAHASVSMDAMPSPSAWDPAPQPPGRERFNSMAATPSAWKIGRAHV